ncbi:carboxymuconolactone decarboxylase family protein, partial [Actinophytocola sp.]|uniref:carboxymuconolactone decarboxylase family protein n=1 Tax=Actinophytocola sp. TaxID=1872138 RepID=UPI00389A75DB
EARDFLVTRRAKITPDQAGLTIYGGNRRVPGLRREEVALLAGVSADYYTRLEKGNLAGVSDSVLDAVAGALQLDEAERVYLFDLARTANAAGRPHTGAPQRRRPQHRVRPVVQQILDSMTTTAAFVRNGRLDILGTNLLGRALYSPVSRACAPAARTTCGPAREDMSMTDHNGQAEPSGAQKMLGDFAPALVRLTDDVLFGEVWQRTGLTPKERSLVTVAALATNGNTEQLVFHLDLARKNGNTEAELVEAITHLAFYAGWPRAMSAMAVAKQVFTH